MRRKTKWISLSIVISFATALFLLFHLLLVKISPHLSDLIPLKTSILILFLSLEVLAGFLYLLLPSFLDRLRLPQKALLLFGIGMGIALRGFMFFSTPIQETDYYRYLWDGAVTAHGMNPFRYSPATIQNADPHSALPSKMQQLRKNAGDILPHINHSDLRTIYPTTAQALFAVAHVLRPFSLNGLRLLYLGIDLLVLFLLIQLLRTLKKAPYWALLYWCNPLLLKEIYNSAHMDILLFPFLLSALWFAFQKRTFLSLLLLALSAGVKVWPLLLLPLFIAFLCPTRSRRTIGTLFFTGILFLLFLPILVSGGDPQAGWVAYGKEWEMNDAGFLTILTATSWITDIFQHTAIQPSAIARVLAASFLLFTALLMARQPTMTRDSLLKKALALIVLLFLLSPAPFPWYSLWFLPLLTFHPNFALLSLTPLLNLYYLRPLFVQMEKAEIFDHGIVWIEFLPPILLLFLTHLNQRHPYATFIQKAKAYHFQRRIEE